MVKPGGKRPLGRPRRRWDYNIKLDLQQIGWEGVGWIHLAQDTEKGPVLVNTMMNIWVP